MRAITISQGPALRAMFQFFTAVLLVSVLAGCGKDKGIDPADNKVTLLTLSPISPATLNFGDKVTITYDYEVVDPAGVRIWVQPYTNGSISPKYSYTSSPLFKDSGTKTVTISITSGDITVVDQLKITIANADGSEDISTRYETVNYTFKTP